MLLVSRLHACYLTAVVCPSLPTIANGIIYYSHDVTPDYYLGTEATYTCEAGFYLEGNEVRVCMDDDGMDAIGVWSDQEPSCVRKLSARTVLADCITTEYFELRTFCANIIGEFYCS